VVLWHEVSSKLRLVISMTYLVLEKMRNQFPEGKLEATVDAIDVQLDGDKRVGQGRLRRRHD